MILCIFFEVCVLAEEVDIYQFFNQIDELEVNIAWVGNPDESNVNTYKPEDLKLLPVDETKSNARYYLWCSKNLVIKKMTSENYDEAQCNIEMELNHPNIAKTFLFIKTQREDDVLEYYTINAYYENKITAGSIADDEQHNYLQQIAKGIKYLHEKDIVFANEFGLDHTLSTIYDTIINENQLEFIDNAYKQLFEDMKIKDPCKPELKKRESLKILSVKKNEAALKDSIMTENTTRETMPMTYVLNRFKYAKQLCKNVNANNGEDKLTVYDSYLKEKNGDFGKALDCYLFGHLVNGIFMKCRIEHYEHVGEGESVYLNDIRKNLKNSKNIIDRLISHCTEPDPNERPNIDQIILILVHARVVELNADHGLKNEANNIKLTRSLCRI